MYTTRYKRHVQDFGRKLPMKLVCSHDGYDFYIGQDFYGYPIYNIVPLGAAKPATGYMKKEYIENVKHVKFWSLGHD